MLGLHRLPDRSGRARPRLDPLPHPDAGTAQQIGVGTEQAARAGALVAAVAGLFLAALLTVTLSWWSVEPDCGRADLATFGAACADKSGPASVVVGGGH